MTVKLYDVIILEVRRKTIQIETTSRCAALNAAKELFEQGEFDGLPVEHIGVSYRAEIAGWNHDLIIE